MLPASRPTQARRWCIRTARATSVSAKSAPLALPSPVDRPHGSGLRRKVDMADVACFCGCCFSFDGDAEACPKCGEVARVATGPVPDSAGRSRPELPVPVMNGAGPKAQTLGTSSERTEAGAR
jgi:hypothetical protein